jgi:putative ABC transport system permease protein
MLPSTMGACVMTMPARLRMLDRKLLRDLWAMKGQAVAIAAVMAAGVTMFVAYFSNFDSLQRARASYYQHARFADVFVSLTRAPSALEGRIAAIPGVHTLATRVIADVTLDVPGMAEPATGRLIAVPERGRPPLNDVFLRRGRWLDPARADEVLASEMFCESHGLDPGDRIGAIINGRRRELTIVGVALSPEYVYAIAPGEMFPDTRRFGIFWMNRRSLASAFDMQGGFNEVSVRLGDGASRPEVMATLDRLLEPYGGRGAIPQSLQMSAWTLDNELNQLQTFGLLVPAIFLGVAAFVLHVALTRALALQRAQIAALKALGYRHVEIAWHYVKWALAIAAAASLAGVAVGAWLGSSLIGVYNQFFRFPTLAYHLSASLALLSIAGCLVVAALGAQAAVRRAVRVPPAEAMRPEAPAHFHRSVVETRWRPLRLSFTMRMIVRALERQPMKALASIVGIAFAVAVLFVGLAFTDVMNTLIDDQFMLTMRQDATLTFVQPRPGRVLHDVQHLPGVFDVEPARIVPVRLRAGTRSRTLAITGLPAAPHLTRVIDRTRGPIELPAEGLLLSQMLGDVLGVIPGDTIVVEVLEGHRPVRTLTVAALVDDSLGLQAYMRLEPLRRVLHEDDTISSIALTMDPAERDRFYEAVKGLPAIAGVAMRDVALQNFRDTMAEHMDLSIFINVIFAAIIACGVVYNAARVSLSERSRELASLRVLGFTRAEISMILLGEIAILTTLALPIGVAIGYLFGELIMAGFTNEVYRLSFVARPATIAWAWLTVIAATIGSGLLVRRRLDRLDLVAVLKTPE